MLNRRTLVAAALTAAVLPLHAESPKEINFGIISTDSSAALRSRWQPVLDDMAARTGVKVNGFFATDYAGVIEAMRFKKVDLAWFGNKAAMEAVDRAGGEIFAQTVKPDGDGYYSLLITNASSSIKTFDDVLKRGKEINFGNGDPNSTSGFLVPSYYVFAMNNVDPKAHFKTVRSANHETNLQAVLNKQIDVATNNTEQMYLLEKNHPEKVKEVRVLWKSPLIPSDPVERERLLGIQEWIGFKPSSNAQLIPIRQLELFREKSKLAVDAAVPEADKKAKIAEIDKKLAELNAQLSK